MKRALLICLVLFVGRFVFASEDDKFHKLKDGSWVSKAVFTYVADLYHEKEAMKYYESMMGNWDESFQRMSDDYDSLCEKRHEFSDEDRYKIDPCLIELHSVFRNFSDLSKIVNRGGDDWIDILRRR
jgi:hypothetical protein